jgi:hypothetical protein
MIPAYNKRLNTPFGDTGLAEGEQPQTTGLRPFGARYRFQDRTFTLTLWAYSYADASRQALALHATLDGEITDVLPD